jgi:hypothetical protein
MKRVPGEPVNGYSASTWTCRGWDGEGCPAVARPDGWRGWTVTL